VAVRANHAFAVIRGLDPRIHHLHEKHCSKRMDCRVKPGNDTEV